METDTMEKLLRKAPPVRTPPGLLQNLRADIALPQSESRIANRESRSSSGWFRRWIPAFGLALWFLGCVVAFGIQSGWIAELRDRQRGWEAARAAAVQQSVAAEAARVAAGAELEQLKKDLADVQRLRAELQQLRHDTEALAVLRAQNEQLRDELKAQTPAWPKPEEDFFAVAQERAIKIKCVHNLKLLGLAARMWANESKSEVMPDGGTLKSALLNIRDDDARGFGGKNFFCPRDGTTSYEILGPGAPERRPEIIYSRCPIHNNFGLSDGSVHQIDPSQTQAVQKDGWWVLERR